MCKQKKENTYSNTVRFNYSCFSLIASDPPFRFPVQNDGDNSAGQNVGQNTDHSPDSVLLKRKYLHVHIFLFESDNMARFGCLNSQVNAEVDKITLF